MDRLKTVLVSVFGAAAGCWLQRYHNTRRHYLGGQVCLDCDGKFRDLQEAGLGDDQLHYGRAYYNREEGSFTRENGF